MLNINQFRELIIKPTLQNLMLYSESAEELLVFTCATESLGGTFLKQEKGPALGIYQMEPATYNDLWQNYIKSNPSIMTMLMHNFSCIFMPDEHRLIYDLWYATAMCRLHYARVRAPLPAADDLESIWAYYKTFYNTEDGKAEKLVSLSRYHMFTKR
jgi:hypothetical protein